MMHCGRLATFALALSVGCLLAATVVAAEKPTIVGARLGLGDQYKLGCWSPLRVSIEGGVEPMAVQIVAITPDSDGVGAATLTPGGRPTAAEPARPSDETLYIRPGQQNAPVEVQLLSGGRVVDRLTMTVGAGDPELIATGKELPLPTPSTGRLYLQLGAESGLGEAIGNVRNAENWQNDLSAALVSDVAQLPRDAIGYDSFDCVVLVAGSRAGSSEGGWLGELTADDPRLVALIEWIESGGRLVLSCGSGGAALLGPGGALESLAPGTYRSGEPLTTATAIESYAAAGSETSSIDLAGATLAVTRLENVEGTVEAYAGRSTAETPLVIRTPRGFGEVTLVTFDLDAPAIAGWKGRASLVQKLIGLQSETPDSQPNYGWYGQSDLVNRLIDRLDNAFTGVKTAPFLLIVGLVILYLLLIGPGDYFFVKNVLKRVEATWITFPLLVIGTSVAAFTAAYWLKGDTLRVNQVEIIDVDNRAGLTRGTLVTHLFSPRASRYNFSLATHAIDGSPLVPNRYWTAWLGKPGYGLGGMQSGGGNSSMGVRGEYRLDATPQLNPTGLPNAAPDIAGMPVQVWSTKTLLSRYLGRTPRRLDTNLTPTTDGLVDGPITNDTGTRLIDCRLLYGTWAWRLKDLRDGETVDVNVSISPVRITTLLGNRNTDNPYGGGGYQANRYAVTQSVDELAESLAVGSLATGSKGVASRYLHELDLTHHLPAGKALLLARVEAGSGSELLRDGESLTNDEEDEQEGPSRRSWVFARFILEVEE